MQRKDVSCYGRRRVRLRPIREWFCHQTKFERPSACVGNSFYSTSSNKALNEQPDQAAHLAGRHQRPQTLLHECD